MTVPLLCGSWTDSSQRGYQAPQAERESESVSVVINNHFYELVDSLVLLQPPAPPQLWGPRWHPGPAGRCRWPTRLRAPGWRWGSGRPVPPAAPGGQRTAGGCTGCRNPPGRRHTPRWAGRWTEGGRVWKTGGGQRAPVTHGRLPQVSMCSVEVIT